MNIQQNNLSVDYEIKYREYDNVNRRDGFIIRTITRNAKSDREAENKVKNFSPNCRIMSCKVKDM